MNRKVAIPVVLVALGLGVFAFFMFFRSEDQLAGREESLQADQAFDKLVQARGPKPENSRLRDGAKQIESPSEALEEARESLARIERELASVTDEDDRKRLLRKKELVQRMVERFAGGAD